MNCGSAFDEHCSQVSNENAKSAEQKQNLEAMVTTFHLLGISGSLRAASSNTALLQAAARLIPPDVDFRLYEHLALLPAFNPDHENDPITEVLAFRAALSQADAVMFSTLEYAHGVPGSLKNALDWVVGSGELVNKPVAMLNASSRSVYAQSSLTETLTVMSARLIPEATVTLSLLGKGWDEATICADAVAADLLRSALSALIAVLKGEQA